MDNAEVCEGLNEWEQIRSPCSAAATTAQWNDDTVVIKENFFDECSIFPPDSHEGLPITPQDNQEPPSLSSSVSSSLLSGEGNGEGGPVGGAVGRGLRSRLGLLSSGIVRIAYMVRNYAMCRVGFLSIASATSGVLAVVLVSLLYVRMRRWRNRRRVQVEDKDRLMVLVREKDQKINHLLLQISQLNEVLLARRRVPILRAG